tara:strand:+ start:2133 stop:2834 length:702 start_codon:yes stop_codon:yes gene_type:complete
MEPIINVLIPARSGSKGIKNKNLCKVHGIPLYERSIKHALKLKKHFNVNIYLSTDIKEIINKSDTYKDINIIERSNKLSGDDILTIDVAKDLIIKQNLKPKDILVLFQPTSPFRNIDEICSGINYLKCQKKWKSVVSLNNVGSYHPFRMKRLTSDMECIDFIDQGFEDMRPRQSLTKIYIRSGNFYITFIEYLINLNTFLPKPTKGIIHQDKKSSINIDNVEDLHLAEIIDSK